MSFTFRLAYSAETASDAYQIILWVGPRALMNILVEEENLLLRTTNLWSSSLLSGHDDRASTTPFALFSIRHRGLQGILPLKFLRQDWRRFVISHILNALSTAKWLSLVKCLVFFPPFIKIKNFLWKFPVFNMILITEVAILTFLLYFPLFTTPVTNFVVSPCSTTQHWSSRCLWFICDRWQIIFKQDNRSHLIPIRLHFRDWFTL